MSHYLRLVNHVAGDPACFSRELRPIFSMREASILNWMRHTGRQLGAIALLALLVRAILPAGYMVASAETPSGRFLVIELCSNDGSVTQALNLDTGERIGLNGPSKSGQPKHKPGEAPCVFATTAHFATPVQPTVSAPVQTTNEAGLAFVADLRPGRGIAAPPPPSTGPPTRT